MSRAPELSVRVNGHHAAWPAKLAARGPRDDEVRRTPYRAANTSISLIVRRGDELLLHVLVDAGLGVVNSLLELQQTTGVDRVDALLLTHPHFDHVAGLDWLLASLSRSRVPGQPWPLPLYCTAACFEAIFEPPRLLYFWRESVAPRVLAPAMPATINGPNGIAVRVTAVPVEHGPTAPGAAILALEADLGGVQKRIGVAWDLLRLQPDADAAPFHGCDLLFVDSTTVHPQGKRADSTGHRNWHLSVEEMLPLTAPWRPSRTYLIHYSGSHDEDPPSHDCLVPEVTRALTHYELTQLAARLGARFGRDLRVAEHGLIVPDLQDWPEPVSAS